MPRRPTDDDEPMDLNRLMFREFPRSLKHEVFKERPDPNPLVPPVRLRQSEPYRATTPQAAEKRASMKQLRARTK